MSVPQLMCALVSRKPSHLGHELFLCTHVSIFCFELGLLFLFYILSRLGSLRWTHQYQKDCKHSKVILVRVGPNLDGETHRGRDTRHQNLDVKKQVTSPADTGKQKLHTSCDHTWKWSTCDSTYSPICYWRKLLEGLTMICAPQALFPLLHVQGWAVADAVFVVTDGLDASLDICSCRAGFCPILGLQAVTSNFVQKILKLPNKHARYTRYACDSLRVQIYLLV